MFGVLIPVYEHAMDVTEDELTASMTRLSHHWGPIMVTAQMILVCSTPRAQSCNNGTKYWLNNTQISKSSFTHLIWAIFICLIFEFSCFLSFWDKKSCFMLYTKFYWLLSIIIPFLPCNTRNLFLQCLTCQGKKTGVWSRETRSGATTTSSNSSPSSRGTTPIRITATSSVFSAW